MLGMFVEAVDIQVISLKIDLLLIADCLCTLFLTCWMLMTYLLICDMNIPYC